MNFKEYCENVLSEKRNINEEFERDIKEKIQLLTAQMDRISHLYNNKYPEKKEINIQRINLIQQLISKYKSWNVDENPKRIKKLREEIQKLEIQLKKLHS